MSIINQALQKAQREQLHQRAYDVPYLSAGERRRTARRRWLMLSLGCSMVLGLGGMGARWLLPASSPPLAVLPEAPPVPRMTFVESALRETPRPTPIPMGAEAPVGEPAEPQREAVPAAPAGATSPMLVLAVESSSVLQPGPVPRVLPLPASPVPLSEPEGAAPSIPARSVPFPSDVARGQVLLQQALEVQERGDLPRAATLLEQAVRLDPTAKAAYNSLGNVYFQQKRFHQAVSVYQKVLALDPDYTKARNNLGSAYMQLAMYEQAIEELQRALRSEEGASLAYYNLACVYARKGESASAAQYLQQAILLEPQARIWARTDADFASVRGTLAVQQLLEP